MVAKRSTCAEGAKRAQQARLMAHPPIERMKKALQAGRTARAVAALGAQSRGAKRYAGGRKSRHDVHELLDANPAIDLEEVARTCADLGLADDWARIVAERS